MDANDPFMEHKASNIKPNQSQQTKVFFANIGKIIQGAAIECFYVVSKPLEEIGWWTFIWP